MNILFIAPPAAGKGTQSIKVSAKYGIPHISTGDLLRESNDEKIHLLIKCGKFVSDEIVTNLLEERLKEKDCENGFVLDGFPRNLSQAKLYEELLDRINKTMGVVIVLDLDKKIAERRITGRITCPSCGSVFNEYLEDAIPERSGLCDYCHHSLVKRDDDNVETFENRYSTYIKETQPLIEYYESKKVVYHVNSGINSDFTFKQIENIIDNNKTRR